MRYITIKSFNRKGIGGPVGIPHGAVVEKRENGMIYYNNIPICVSRSFAAHEHFARDDDGAGLRRGRITYEIIDALGGMKRGLDENWAAVMEDEIAQKYRRPDHVDYWLWSDDFYNAPMNDLIHIAKLAGVKEEILCTKSL